MSFLLPKLILPYLFPWQKESQYTCLRTPVTPFQTFGTTTGFLSPELYILVLDPAMPGIGRSQNRTLLLPLGSRGSSGGDGTGKSSWSPPHLDVPRKSRNQPAKPWGCPDERMKQHDVSTFIIISSLVPFHALLLSRFLPSRYLLCG